MYIKEYFHIIRDKFLCYMSNGDICVLFGRPVINRNGNYVPDKDSVLIFSYKTVLPNISSDKFAFIITHEVERQNFVREYGNYVILPKGTLINIDDFVEDGEEFKDKPVDWL